MKSEKKLAFVVFDEYFMTQLNFLIEFFLCDGWLILIKHCTSQPCLCAAEH